MKSARVPLDTGCRGPGVEEFERAIRARIIGQQEAVDAMVQVYQTFMAGFSVPGRPIANLLLLGPTGTGKTRLVEAAADVLFGQEQAYIRVDCGEMQHSHEIAKIVGSPPGYLGHRETHPLLTQEALDQWHTEKLKVTLVLFDEIEKASDALWRLLLGIMDKASLTLGDNRRVNFSNCVIVLTSNLGSAEIENLQHGSLGFGSAQGINSNVDGKIEKVAKGAATRKFPAEFMNRLDKMVVYRSLHQEELRKVLRLELGKVQKRILSSATNHKFVFRCSEEAEQFLVDQGTDSRYGARHLKRAIEKYLVVPLSGFVTSRQLEMGDLVSVFLDGDKLRFERIPGELVARLSEEEWEDFKSPVE